MSKQFYFKQLNLNAKTVNSRNYGLVLLDPYMGHLLGATTLRQSGSGSDVSKAHALYEPHHEIV